MKRIRTPLPATRYLLQFIAHDMVNIADLALAARPDGRRFDLKMPGGSRQLLDTIYGGGPDVSVRRLT